MATRPLTVANMRHVFRSIEVDAMRNMERTLTAVAAAGERQIKVNASNGAHKRGTPTPATRPHGPAVITGNLRRNVTREPTRREGATFVARIGVASGAPYGKHVERLGYLFVSPVVPFLKNVVIRQVAQREFRNWRRADGSRL